MVTRQDVFEAIFPEYAESEDERTRKEIIRIVDIWTNSSPVVNGIPREILLAWLEKQKENTWSEDDDAKVNAMCKEGNLKPSEREWLKNLRNRVWKM